MRSSLLVALSNLALGSLALGSLALGSLGGCQTRSPAGPDASMDAGPDAGLEDSACSIASEVEQRPGFPFDYRIFEEQVLPILRARCSGGPCHDPGTSRSFTVWPDKGEPCDAIRTFNAVHEHADVVQAPRESKLLTAIDGTFAAHPFQLVDADGLPDEELTTLIGYIEDAHRSYLDAASDMRLDFAFFARRVNALFDEERTGEGGAPGLGCASQACHGVSAPGERPASRADLALLPDASVERDLLLNFAAAANFVYLPEPGQSSLLLYPSNETANRANPLATGLAHGGGKVLDLDDPAARVILEWVGGLRPDADGFQRNWLVTGDFPASAVTDEPIPGERDLRPRIFEPSAETSQLEQGRWDGFFARDGFVDLDDPEQGFPRAGAGGRMVYAVSYLRNTSTRDIDLLIIVRSPNHVQLVAGDQESLGQDGTPATVTVSLPGASRSSALTRILIKVFQGADDDGFGFDARLLDVRNGQPLTNVTGELIIGLGPEGGV